MSGALGDGISSSDSGVNKSVGAAPKLLSVRRQLDLRRSEHTRPILSRLLGMGRRDQGWRLMSNQLIARGSRGGLWKGPIPVNAPPTAARAVVGIVNHAINHGAQVL